MSVTAAEIMARCDQLAAVSDTPGIIRRVYLSPEHARVNAMAAGWMREAGMSSWTDAAGNQALRGLANARVCAWRLALTAHRAGPFDLPPTATDIPCAAST